MSSCRACRDISIRGRDPSTSLRVTRVSVRVTRVSIRVTRVSVRVTGLVPKPIKIEFPDILWIHKFVQDTTLDDFEGRKDWIRQAILLIPFVSTETLDLHGQ